MKISKLNSVDFDKIILLGIEEVWGFDRATGEAVFAFDQVKSGELSGANDVSYAEGKRGVRLATMKTNKTSSFTCENGYVVFSALGRQIGADVEEAFATGSRKEHESEVIEVVKNKLNLSHKPDPSTANDVIVYSMVDGRPDKKLTPTTDYTVYTEGTPNYVGITSQSEFYNAKQGTPFMVEYDYTAESKPITVARTEYVRKAGDEVDTITLSTTPKTGTFEVYSLNMDQTVKMPLLTSEYSLSGKTLTLKGTQAAMPKDTMYLCTYDEEVTVAKRIVNDGETFSDDVRLVINMLGQDVCSGLQYMVQCIMPKATVSGEWNLSLGTDPAVHNFSAEASLDICSVDKELCEFIVC